MENVILYCRVSSDEQAEGCSLNEQERQMRSYCLSKGYNVVDVYYEDYKTDIENQLEKILSSVKGAGGVDVMVTLEAGQEIVYVQQEKTVKDQSNITGDKSDQQTIKDSYENEIVMIEENNQKQALVEKVLEPVVQGVVVVCGGADDISVVSDITNAVCIALNITSNRVCVIKMK